MLDLLSFQLARINYAKRAILSMAGLLLNIWIILFYGDKCFNAVASNWSWLSPDTQDLYYWWTYDQPIIHNRLFNIKSGCKKDDLFFFLWNVPNLLSRQMEFKPNNWL